MSLYLKNIIMKVKSLIYCLLAFCVLALSSCGPENDDYVDKVVELGKAKLVSNRINCTGKATINSLIDNVIQLYKINFNIK